MGDKDEAKDDRKTAVGTGGAPNVAKMVQVTPWTIGKPGKVTAVQGKDKMSLNAPDVRVTTQAMLSKEATDAPDDIGEVEVGPIQNVISSSRVAKYVSLTEPGKVVATYHSNVSTATLDQARMDPTNPAGTWSAWQGKKPWYSPPARLNKSIPNGDVTFFDKPGFDLPLSMSGGVLTEVTGADNFSLSIGARQNGGPVTFYESKNWSVPWNATFDPASHNRTDKEKEVDAPKRDPKDPKTFVKDPTKLDGPIALDTRDYYSFPTVEAARAAGVDVLFSERGLIGARNQDRASYDNMFHAIRGLNPNWVITIHCLKHKTFWQDDVSVTMKGHTNKTEAFKIEKGQQHSVAVRFLEIFDPHAWVASSNFRFEFTAGGMKHVEVIATQPSSAGFDFTKATTAKWGKLDSEYYQFSVTRTP